MERFQKICLVFVTYFVLHEQEVDKLKFILTEMDKDDQYPEKLCELPTINATNGTIAELLVNGSTYSWEYKDDKLEHCEHLVSFILETNEIDDRNRRKKEDEYVSIYWAKTYISLFNWHGFNLADPYTYTQEQEELLGIDDSIF